MLGLGGKPPELVIKVERRRKQLMPGLTSSPICVGLGHFDTRLFRSKTDQIIGHSVQCPYF